MTAQTAPALPTNAARRDAILALRVEAIGKGITLERVEITASRPQKYHLVIRHEGDGTRYPGSHWVTFDSFADLEHSATPQNIARMLWDKRYSLYANWERVQDEREAVARYETYYGRAVGQLYRIEHDRTITEGREELIASYRDSVDMWERRLIQCCDDLNAAHDRVLAIIGPRP